ncbi:hypothetical protein EPN52_12860 [bacterium]|nr:MAG: hypothetical protein EPN52_12860 [bacterium]
MDSHYDTETLVDYLHGALDASADAAIFSHLSSCADCRAAYQAEVELGEALRAAARSEQLNLPGSVVARIRQAAAREGTAGSLRAWFSSARLVWALPAAAAVALALWFGGNDLRGITSGAPAIDAAYYFEAHDAQMLSIPDGERNAPLAFAPADRHQHLDAAWTAPTEAYLGLMAPGAGPATN